MSERIEEILRGAGLTDRPDEFGDGIHGWRCEHPDRYGRCDCFADLVAALSEHDRQVQAQYLRELAEKYAAFTSPDPLSILQFKGTAAFMLAEAEAIEKGDDDERLHAAAARSPRSIHCWIT